MECASILASRTGQSPDSYRMFSVLIVDDHVVVRQGLKQILSEEFCEAEFGEAQHADEAMNQVQRRHWDVIILDINIPGRSGLEILEDIRRTSPETHILVLTMYPERQYAMRALRLGASGYMTKDSPRSEFITAFRKVLEGGKYVDSVISEALVTDLARSQPKPHELLSAREYKVMVGLAAGKRVTDVAAEMHLSVKTISTYKRRIFQKMQINSNSELTRYAIGNNLI